MAKGLEEQETEDWEKEWERFVEENELHGIDFSYSEDLIKSFIRTHKQKWEEESYKKALKEVMSKMTGLNQDQIQMIINKSKQNES